MKKATHAEVCDGVVQAWKAVKVSSIKNGFGKAGITRGTDDDASQTSDISDDETSNICRNSGSCTRCTTNGLNSDAEDEDLNGFELNLLYNSSFNTRSNFLSTNQHGAEQSLAQNVATNSHSVKYETLRFGYGSLLFLLYNFINKVYSNIDTELCTRLNKCHVFATKKLNNITCGFDPSERIIC